MKFGEPVPVPWLEIIVFIVFLVALFLMSAIKVLREYERAVRFRLGRYVGIKGPGLVLLCSLGHHFRNYCADRVIFVQKTYFCAKPPGSLDQNLYKRNHSAVGDLALIYR